MEEIEGFTRALDRDDVVAFLETTACPFERSRPFLRRRRRHGSWSQKSMRSDTVVRLGSEFVVVG